MLRFDHPLQSVAALHGKLLVEMNSGRTCEDRIDALAGKVARLIVPIYQLGNDNRPDPAVARSNPFIFQAERATCAPLLGYPDAPPPRGQRLEPEVAKAMPAMSPDRPHVLVHRLRKRFRFAPPSNASGRRLDVPVLDRASAVAEARRATPGIGVLGDLVGAKAFTPGVTAHVSGIRVRGQTAFRSRCITALAGLPRAARAARTSARYRATRRILPGGSSLLQPPGAGPYTSVGFIFNGEYAVLRRNPNYGGSRPQRLDAIGFREEIDTGRRSARIERGGWDAVERFDPACAGTASSRAASATPGARRLVPVLLAPRDLLPCLQRAPAAVLGSETPASGNGGARP